MPGSKTRRITVFTPEAGGFFVGDVFKGVDEVCRSRRAQSIIVQTALSWEASAFEPLPLERYVGLANCHRHGSIVVTSVQNEGDLDFLRRIEGPVVAIAGPPLRDEGVSVVVDNAGGAAQAVRHLIDHGHTRIGFVGALFQSDVRERYVAYLEALEAAGINPDPALCFAVHDDLMWGGRDAGSAIIEAGMPLTAVFASTDTHAVALMGRLREAGVRVPEDVAVVGFDDAELAQTAVPSLTSIRQTPGLLGSAAARLVLDEIDGIPAEPGRHVLPAVLIKRHSCGCFDAHERLPDDAVDWTCPEWREHLARLLVRALLAPSELPGGPADEEGVWPSVGVVIDAFERAIQGEPVSNISGLDEAWWEASTRTRNAETLLRLVDLLEFVGLCRQGEVNADVSTLRSRLRDFLAQSRMQVLRYAAIADPMRHPDIPKALRRLVRSFQDDVPGNRPSLGWLSHVDAVSGCLALWEPVGPNGRPGLRIEALFGAVGETQGGSVVGPESFPPLTWLDASRVGKTPRTVTIVPVVSPARDWGLLATVLPDEVRYYDGYWGLQYGAAILALLLDRARAQQGQ